jgi:hypothetical protein
MSTSWKVSGTYFEACNCETVCPCIYLGAPTSGQCTAVVAWHINQGSYGETKLDGLNVVLAVYSPGPMLKSKWQVALYLDKKASSAQAEALGGIFSGQSGGHLANLAPLIGEVKGVKSVTIDYRAEGKKRSVTIGDVGQLEIEAVAGANGAESTIENAPLAVVVGEPLVVARSKKASYADLGLKLEVSDRNGFYSPFSYQSG